MNIPTFDALLYINYDTVQDAVENVLLNSYANMWLMEWELHVASGCPCNGLGHCTVLRRRTGQQRKTYTKGLKKLKKEYRILRLKQTLYRKKKTTFEHPIEIE